MGELKRVYVRCPVCAHVFRAPSIRVQVTIGRDSDLCPRFPGRQPDGSRALRAAVTMCPNCCFASPEDFGELELPFDERIDVEDRLGEDGLIRVMRSSPPPWLAFHAAEICGSERGFDARQLGDICLRGSWVCRRERESPFESTFQLRAVRHFMRAVEGNLHGRELSVTTYLVGELNRRLGRHREALNWYVNAERTIRDAPNLAWLDRLIARQRELAEEQAA